MFVSAAYSIKKDSYAAGSEVVSKVLEQTSSPVVAFLFTTDQYDQQEVLRTVRRRLGDVPLAGLTTGGVIYANKVYNRGIVLLALSSAKMLVDVSFNMGISNNGYETGRKIGKKFLKHKCKNGTVCIFPDSFSDSVSSLIEGLYDTMGPDYLYFGGGSGDNLHFTQSYQFSRTKIASDSVVSVFMSGPSFTAALGHGWQPAGEPVVITSVRGNRVYEISGYPAFEAYKKRYPEICRDTFAESAMNHPLGFPDILGNYCIRDPFTLHDDDSIEFVGEVPDQAVGSMMQSNIQNLLASSQKVAQSIQKKVARPKFLMVCDCISRYILMKGHFQKELENLSRDFGSETPIVGFLSFGEIGALHAAPSFHNKTLAVLAGKA